MFKAMNDITKESWVITSFCMLLIYLKTKIALRRCK